MDVSQVHANKNTIDKTNTICDTVPREAVGEPPPKQGKDTLKNSAGYKRKKPSVYVMPTDQYARLRAIGTDPEIAFRVLLKRIYAETDLRLDTLARQVREAKAVNEASNFCRWLQFSGVMSLLALCPIPEIDLKAFERKLRDIIWDCGELYKGGKANAKYAESDIAEINRKLDLLASQCLGGPTVSVAVRISPASQDTASDGESLPRACSLPESLPAQ